MLGACGEVGKSAVVVESSNTDKQTVALMVWGTQAELGENNDGWLPAMCENFEKLHTQWEITWIFDACEEDDIVSRISADPVAAADVYSFTNNQLDALLNDECIAPLSETASKQILDDNTKKIADSVTVAGKVYGVPFSGKTWFMYYDTTVFSESDVKNLDLMLEKGRVSFPLTAEWYFGAFYLANGCSVLGNSTDDSISFDFSADKALPVTEYLATLVKNPNFVIDADGTGLQCLSDGVVSAIFTGTWEKEVVQQTLGETWTATIPPTVTIVGEEKQLAPFGVVNAVAVNPHTKNFDAAEALALYLASPEIQMERYEFMSAAPVSKKLLKENNKILSDYSCIAMVETMEFCSVTQPDYPHMENYWSAISRFSREIVDGTITDKNALEKTENLHVELNQQVVD